MSALAPASSSPGSVYLQQQQQQRRSLSIQSDDNQDAAEQSGAAAAVEAAVEDSEEGEEQVAEAEVGEETRAEGPEPCFLIQADGIPFTIQQEDIERWFAEAGCTAGKVTVPLWPDRSMRAGQNKGRAYLEFGNKADMQAALALSGRAIGERWINISRLSMPLEKVRTYYRERAAKNTHTQRERG